MFSSSIVKWLTAVGMGLISVVLLYLLSSFNQTLIKEVNEGWMFRSLAFSVLLQVDAIILWVLLLLLLAIAFVACLKLLEACG